MILAILAIFTGLFILVKSADMFVHDATIIANFFGISPLIIGITVVALGTSAPEIVISSMAAWNQAPNIAIGNAIGSNIANISLVLGTTALFAPIAFKGSLLRLEFPILIAGALLGGYLLLDLTLGLGDGLILLTGLFASLYLLIKSKSSTTHSLADTEPQQVKKTTYAILIFSILLMATSARMLVWGSVQIATSLGVSELIIGLTIVAIGTSLPELATSIVSAQKGKHDLALGNIIGSNTFNLLAVMAIPGLIYPATFSSEILWRDYSVMLFLTFALFGVGMIARKNGAIGRIKGSLLLAVFVGYNAMLYLTA